MGKIIKIFFLFVFVTLLNLQSNSQILTFDFAGNTGSEVTDVSNFNNVNLGSSTISRGAGLTASANADRFNATNWALTSIANAVTGNNYMEFTVTPNGGFQFSVSSIIVSIQRSATGPSGIAIRSSEDGYVTNLGGAFAITDNTSTQTFTFTFSQTNACNQAVTYRIYMFAEATGGSGGPGDFAGNDIIVNGTVTACSINTISTSAISGSPFSVTCTASSAVNVDFTSVGTFTAGNIYTAELSDATGSFAFPTPIGTLSSTANAGTINATIPANTPTGAAYRIRVISDSPITTGTDNGTNLTINLTGGSCGISTSAIAGSPFAVTCGAGAAVNVDFTSIGTFNVGNIYTAQLSNSAGSFASPVIIGTLNSTANAGTIASTIPAGTLTGAGYRIRVISSSPVYTGSDNGSNLTINLSGGPCVSGITTGAILGSPFAIDCNIFEVITVPFTATGTYNVGNIFRAQLSDASGSFAFPITIGELTLSGVNPVSTIPSTIFAGLTPGANYRIRVVSTNPVNTGTDNGTNLTITNPAAPCYGPIIVNEISQGASGNYEYMEFLVIANDPCATMDIRNFVLDDNNGDFSGGPTSGVGIAAGHVRLTNSNQWANVPSGSLIVVYNNIQRGPTIPADDPSDLLVPDKVYILPVNSSLLEGCVTRPTSADASYSPCTYGVGDWAYISMANAADAAQVRYPNYTYSHGFSWGGAPMNGGPDGLNIGTGTTSNTVIEFENSTNNSYTTTANFTRTTVASGETPGAPNSVNNSLFIASLTCLALPAELLDFNVLKLENSNYISWRTASEKNTAYFSIEKSFDMINFFPIGMIDAAGNSSVIKNYSINDDQINEGITYYRLKMVDLNGEFEYSQPRMVSRASLAEGPFFIGYELNLQSCEDNASIKVFDVSGKLVDQRNFENENYSIQHLQNGLYLIHVLCDRKESIFKISVSK